ncbi:MAG: electron transfer flavoprotein subunit beta/FixA family protein [Elusimicrobiaceae bacterium]|nr:electron transfer flavoprotein subunit beta/FixA family protein [Elusimicrobiaceae bacterium]
MDIIVCLKQVPNTAKVKMNQDGTLLRAGVPSILNPCDHFALAKALEIKKKTGAKVKVLSMGPSQAAEVLRLALALGADEAYLLCDKAFAGSDTWATAYALSRAVKKIAPFNLILCGQMAIDGDTAQTGPEIAGQLNIPQITFCTDIELKQKDTLLATKLIEGGHQILEVSLPVLITLTTPHNFALPYPNFKAIFEAQQKPLFTWTPNDIEADVSKLGISGSPTRVVKIYPPAPKQKGQVLTLSAEETAAKIVKILQEHKVVK